MKAGWTKLQLGQVCSFKYGQMPKKDDLRDVGYPVFSGYGVVGASTRFHYEEPQIIVVARGVGGTGDVKMSPPFCFLTNLSIAVIPEDGRIYKPFLYYRLAGPGLWELRTGSAQAQITIERLRTYEIELPPLNIQRRIASILGAYNELIEVNLRRIALLEEMARRLFEEWFIRFRYPGHEDCKLVDSPRGVVPAGWRISKVRELVERQRNGFVYRKADCQLSGSVIVIDQSSDEMLGYHSNEPDQKATPADPIAIFGDHTCKMQLVVSPFSIGPNTVAFKAKDAVSIYYLFYLIRGLTRTEEYKRHWNELMGNEVLVAPVELTALYADTTRPLFQLEEILQRQNRCLSKQRDLMLPRLISGDLSVSTVERDLEAVA